MSSLLSLPPELFAYIFAAVAECGLNHALNAKLVCSINTFLSRVGEIYTDDTESFDVEVTRAICSTRLLERPQYHTCQISRSLATDYLVARTLANDVTSASCPSHTILNVVNYIGRRCPEMQAQRVQQIRTLAASIAWPGSRSDWRLENHRVRSPPGSGARSCTEYPKQKDIFAASACLGLSVLVRKCLSDDVPHVNTIFGTPLSAAIFQGHVYIVQLLLASTRVAWESLYALEKLKFDYADTVPGRIPDNMLNLLLFSCVTKDAPWLFHKTMIAYAAFSGSKELFYRYLEQLWAENGSDLICCPPGHGHTCVVHDRACSTRWALKFAVQGGNHEVVSSLLGKHVVLDTLESRGEQYCATFRAAVRSGHASVVKLLLKPGAAEIAHHSLRYAVRSGYKEIVQLLLDHNFHVNIEDDSQSTKFTPAMAAVHFGQTEILTMLLSRGARFDAETLQIALDCAERNGYSSMCKILATLNSIKG